ncbi:MAG: UDP-glucose 4-epimerase family protein [Iodobacter sp.]
MRNKILVTGASGFVGKQLLSYFSIKGAAVSALVRSLDGIQDEKHEVYLCDDFSKIKDSDPAFAGIGIVVHAAARVHVMDDLSADPLSEFRKVNVDGTLNLARQAAASGVRRFIFISSVKVNGESTILNQPFGADDVAAPLDPYGISKYEAEQALLQLANETGLEVVIIRPPLVYGPGVKANFASMMKWLQRGVPLPLGAIKNKRSFVAIDNLVDLIWTCVNHPAAANQIFLAGDGQDLSTTELLQGMAKALGVSARLIPVPMSWLIFSAAILNKSAVAQRLCGSLQVDISKAKELLGWIPPVKVDDALLKTARYFLNQNK